MDIWGAGQEEAVLSGRALEDIVCVQGFQGDSCGRIGGGGRGGDPSQLWSVCLEQLDFWEHSCLLCGALSWVGVGPMCACVVS